MMSDSDEEIQKVDEKYVDEITQKLYHQFDAVQVFVTRQEPDGRTMAYSTGRGNFYARWGMIHEWCSRGGGVEDAGLPDEPEQGEGDPPTEEV